MLGWGSILAVGDVCGFGVEEYHTHLVEGTAGFVLLVVEVAHDQNFLAFVD